MTNPVYVSVPWHSSSTTQLQTTECTLALDPDTTDADWPIVILLHGTGGVLRSMSNPGSYPTADPDYDGHNYDFGPVDTSIVDRGWHYYPGVLAWSVKVDTRIQVTGWEPFLNRYGIPTLNYAQTGNEASLSVNQMPLEELLAVVKKLMISYPFRKIAFVTHSRGGIVLRKFLADNVGNAELKGRFAGTVMLHAPNLGSPLAEMAIGVNAHLMDAIGIVSGLAQDLGFATSLRGVTKTINDFVGSAAYADFTVNSPFLSALVASEMAHPPVMPIHTFGGTSPKLVRIWVEWFTQLSGIAVIDHDTDGWHLGFHWQTYKGPLVTESGPIQAIVDDIPGVSAFGPQVTPGLGDILVANAAAMLPSAVMHHVNPINHAQALWDESLQQQALDVLQTMRGHLDKPRLIPSLAAGEYGLAVDGSSHTLHIGCTDSITGKPVNAKIVISGFPPGVANSPMTGIVYDPATPVFVTSWTERGTHGPNMSVCTKYSATHYPPCTLSHPGYDDAGLLLGPSSPNDAPPTHCMDIASNVSVGALKGLQEWLIHHGGDPVPDQSPIRELDQSIWSSIREQLKVRPMVVAKDITLGSAASLMVRREIHN